MGRNARSLRKHMTDMERRLWYGFLRGLPVTVNRQKIIGSCIVDFYCASAGLVIELDGGQHYSDEGLEADRLRDEALRSRGLTVLRYTDREVGTEFQAVCEDILRHLEAGRRRGG